MLAALAGKGLSALGDGFFCASRTENRAEKSEEKFTEIFIFSLRAVLNQNTPELVRIIHI